MKDKPVEGALECLAGMAFGRSRIDSFHKLICVKCGQPADKFTDEISEREYRISGLCQKCQDEWFVEEE